MLQVDLVLFLKIRNFFYTSKAIYFDYQILSEKLNTPFNRNTALNKSTFPPLNNTCFSKIYFLLKQTYILYLL